MSEDQTTELTPAQRVEWARLGADPTYQRRQAKVAIRDMVAQFGSDTVRWAFDEVLKDVAAAKVASDAKRREIAIANGETPMEEPPKGPGGRPGGRLKPRDEIWLAIHDQARGEGKCTFKSIVQKIVAEEGSRVSERTITTRLRDLLRARAEATTAADGRRGWIDKDPFPSLDDLP